MYKALLETTDCLCFLTQLPAPLPSPQGEFKKAGIYLSCYVMTAIIGRIFPPLMRADNGS